MLFVARVHRVAISSLLALILAGAMGLSLRYSFDFDLHQALGDEVAEDALTSFDFRYAVERCDQSVKVCTTLLPLSPAVEQWRSFAAKRGQSATDLLKKADDERTFAGRSMAAVMLVSAALALYWITFPMRHRWGRLQRGMAGLWDLPLYFACLCMIFAPAVVFSLLLFPTWRLPLHPGVTFALFTFGLSVAVAIALSRSLEPGTCFAGLYATIVLGGVALWAFESMKSVSYPSTIWATTIILTWCVLAAIFVYYGWFATGRRWRFEILAVGFAAATPWLPAVLVLGAGGGKLPVNVALDRMALASSALTFIVMTLSQPALNQIRARPR